MEPRTVGRFTRCCWISSRENYPVASPRRVRHGREDVLIVRLANPPSATTDVSDAETGFFVDTPYERLFERNSSFRHGLVV